MKQDRWPGVATAVAVVWIVSNVIWLGIAGPIYQAGANASQDGWLSFAGSFLGAACTLLAAGVALFAAYRTIAPMREQLSELNRQNQFLHYERLRTRAAELHDQQQAIFDITARLTHVDSQRQVRTPQSQKILDISIDRLSDAMKDLPRFMRIVWGDADAQGLQRAFADQCLSTTITAERMHSSALASWPSDKEWNDSFKSAFNKGVLNNARIALEFRIVADEIAELELSILKRPALSIEALKKAKIPDPPPWPSD